MVKIRLEGTWDELQQAQHVLADCHDLNLLQVSDLYKNRGNSKFYRIYIDANIQKKD